MTHATPDWRSADDNAIIAVVARRALPAHDTFPRVTFTQLRVLQAVARTGNMTRAADQLATSQPAVSHAIRNLEQEQRS